MIARGSAQAVARSLWTPIATGLFVLYGLVLLRTAWVSDDAFITFRSIDHFVNGYGLRWNVAERVQAFTHPLWMMLMTAAYAVTREAFFTSIAISIALSLAAVALLAWGIAPGAAPAAVGLSVLVLSRAFVDYSTSGLEGPLLHLLLVAFVALYVRNRECTSIRRLAFVGSLVVLTRPDAIVLVGPALFWAWWMEGKRGAWKDLVVGFLPLVAWELFSLVYYGTLVPNTAFAKLETGIPRAWYVRQGLIYLRNSFTLDPITLLSIAVGVQLTAARAPRREWPLAAGVLVSLFYIVRVGGDFMSGRFLTPALIVAVCLLVRHLTGPRPLWMAIAWVLGIGFTANTPTVFSGPLYIARALRSIPPDGIVDERGYYFPWQGLWRAERPFTSPVWESRDAYEWVMKSSGVVLRDTVGAYPFIANKRDRPVHVVDTMGLADPLLARLPAVPPWRPGHFKRNPPAGYLETLASGRNEIVDRGIAAYYDAIWQLTRAPLWTAERWRTIVGMLLRRYDHLLYGVRRDLLTLKPEDLGRLERLPPVIGRPVRLRGVVVLLDGPVTARQVTITMGTADGADLTLVNRDEEVGTWLLPARRDGTAGAHTRTVAVDRDGPVTFDRVVITPAGELDARTVLGVRVN